MSLRCSYATASTLGYCLYWYRQHQSRALQYILFRGTKEVSSSSDTAEFAHERFSSQADENRTELVIRALELADTALQEAQRERDAGGPYKNPLCLHTLRSRF
ncbi:hypothetical protein Y1Q_0010590 [Alligator mississippiensis]|uniref:Uncharacterized protein n=1 Tax=Alligator mississippiensis TaxID=8496 RepID=A0A151PGI3_ALLMI|nr:hypothetical protein Y1Q_0010590 [Alligator mississippiensis]